MPARQLLLDKMLKFSVAFNILTCTWRIFQQVAYFIDKLLVSHANLSIIIRHFITLLIELLFVCFIMKRQDQMLFLYNILHDLRTLRVMAFVPLHILNCILLYDFIS